MARARQFPLLVALLVVLGTMLGIIQGVQGPPRSAAEVPAPSPWPLGVAIGLTALLLLLEMAKPANRTAGMKPLYMPARVSAMSSQTSETQLVILGEPEHAAQDAVTKADLDYLLRRALDRIDSKAARMRSSPHADSEFGTVRESMGHNLQRRSGVMTAVKVGAMEKTMVEEMELSIKLKLGYIANVFARWRSQAFLHKGVWNLENKLHINQSEWDAYLDEERKRFEHDSGLLREKHVLMQSRWGQRVSLMIEQWAFGDLAGLVIQVFKAWHFHADREQTIREQMRSTEVVARSALRGILKWMDGDTWGTVHAALLGWKAEAARPLIQRVHDRELQKATSEFGKERGKWDTFLEDNSRSHDKALRKLMSEHEIRRAKAYEATSLMLAKWMGGDSKGLMSTVLLDWRKYCDKMNTLQARRQSVHVAVLKFMEGDNIATAHACLLNWKGYTKEQLVYRNEVAEHQRTIVKLQERTKSLLSSEQSRLLKYSVNLGAYDSHMLGLMVISAWRMEAQGLRAMELHRKQEVELEERKRAHDLAVTEHRHHQAAVLRCLGMKDDRLLVIDAFTAWSQVYQQRRQAWAHRLVTNKAAQKYSSFILEQFMVKDSQSLMATVFYEFAREIHRQVHENDREDRLREQEELEISLKTIRRNDVGRMEEELRKAYDQIDKITETLQRELKTKEGLAEELRDACHKLRVQSAEINAQPGGSHKSRDAQPMEVKVRKLRVQSPHVQSAEINAQPGESQKSRDAQPVEANDTLQPEVPQVTCHECSNVYMADSLFCRHCGTPRPGAQASQLSCTKCGNIYMADSSFCRKCGTRRSGEEEEVRSTTSRRTRRSLR
eukprot:TRINITY_DN705_c0_g2_i1.p1 TRINITY_DN705_c0_g2~~TRINITY_DN705_c0_g2_i1.p1  ORF type:complete len:857 (-),score=162.58 TRINITY_DN705_c0_g2_i1:203-2716(-)